MNRLESIPSTASNSGRFPMMPVVICALVGLAFAFFAICGPIGVLREQAPTWTTVIMSCTIAGTFGPIAIVLLGFGWIVWRGIQEERVAVQAYPGEPWKHRSDWANQSSHHGLAVQAFLFVGAAIPLFVLTVGIGCITLAEPLPVGPRWNLAGAYLIVAGFVLLSAYGLGYALNLAFHARRYRSLSCNLATPYFWPGGKVRCAMDWSTSPCPIGPITLHLKCSTTRSYRDSVFGVEVGDSESYEQTNFHAQRLIRNLDSRRLAVQFALPARAPSTSSDAGVRWALRLSWEGAKGFRAIEYELPVFARDLCQDAGLQAEASETNDAWEESELSVSVPTLLELVEEQSGTLLSDGDFLDLRLPLVEQTKFALVTKLAALMILLGAGMVMLSWPGIFLGLVVLVAIRSSVNKRQLLKVNGPTISYFRTTFWKWKLEELELSKVEEFERDQLKPKALTNYAPTHCVVARLPDGTRIVVLENVFTLLMANRISDELNRKVLNLNKK